MEVLKNSWDEIAQLINDDPMRPYRYGMGLRYFKHIDKDCKLIEVGCGEGTGLLYLNKMGFSNLYGVDVSQERIKIAKTRFLGNNVYLASININGGLPFEDKTFDVVISMGVIEHVINPQAFVNEIARIAKDKSIIVISSDCFTWKILQSFKLYKSVQPIDKTLSYSRYKGIFERAGLKIKHFDVFNYPPRGTLAKYYTLTKIINNIGKKIYKMGQVNNDLKEDFFPVFKRISMGMPDYSVRKRIINRVLNICYDENIFFLGKVV